MKKMAKHRLGLFIAFTFMLGANSHAETPNCIGSSTYKGTITWVDVNPNLNGSTSKFQLTTETIVGDKTEVHTYEFQTDPSRSARSDAGKLFYTTFLEAWALDEPITVWCNQKNFVADIISAN